MATLHKIMLAIASSWNNGTSSPAPQGNRALRNKTNALASAFAERQAPNSAKTPPLLNQIGKGIGKFWIPILLLVATALTQAPIEKAGAWVTQDENGNVRSGPSPSRTPEPVAIPLTWGSTNSASSTNSPAATPKKPKPKPKPTPNNPPGSGIGDSIAGNYIYDALTGQRVAITPPMRGKMTAIPSVNQINGTKRRDTVQGENDTRYPQMNLGENDGKTVAYDANHSWTEYYVIHWTKIVPNPHHDPDDEYSLPFIDSDESTDNEGFYDVGDEFKTARQMRHMHKGARKGPKTYSDGYTDWIYVRKGEWILSGESERIKCEHEMVSTIQRPADSRLAKGQTYKVGIKYQIAYLTYNRTTGAFEEINRDPLRNFTLLEEFSATSDDRKIIGLLKQKNTQVVTGPTALGQSELYWESRVEDGIFSSPKTIWERKQHDELKEKEKEEND